MGDREKLFQHDCDRCTFLGQMNDQDVYACWQSGQMATIVFRWGDQPEEYNSGVHLLDALTPELQAAARRWLADDPDVKLILDILKDAGGELPYEQLEHRYDERKRRAS